jgi:hypothetical protein
MRALIVALILALSSILVGATPALADVPVHLHCLTTPGTTTTIAGGLTANAPHDAFTGFSTSRSISAHSRTRRIR